MPFTIPETLGLLGIGLVAGVLGGMLGIGGSVIMIPLMTLLLRQNHHLSQAVAMIVNLFVSAPALIQHNRAKAVRWDVFARMLPGGLVAIIAGVETSNLVSGPVLEKMFGVFLLYVIWTNVQRIQDKREEPAVEQQRIGWLPITIVSIITGYMAGLLGIGGGLVAVPLLQRICNLPLRQCIATTAAVMCVTATIGAARKNLTLHLLTDSDGLNLGLTAMESLAIAAFLAPTAVIGGLIGGRLTHALPLVWVRILFVLLMTWAALDMLHALDLARSLLQGSE